MTSIFLSYARDDDERFVWRLYERLKNARFDVWFDRVSMPSRQLTFYQEIRDAIAGRDRLVLVVGPKAVASDYVKQEWRFAYFEALKCVNPIVRLDGADAGGKSIDGYGLIPEDLHLVHAEDFRRDDEFEPHAENLIRQLSEALPPAGKLVAVPELPPHFVAQPDRIKALRDILLADLTKPVVVSGSAGRVGLQGMGGIGKSVLASALAHRPEVRRAFPDGVYWVTLGQEPHIEELQRSLLKELGDESIFTGIESGKQKLRDALAQRAALLVLDNIWQRPHAEAFNAIGPRCRLMLTTRDAGLVTALASRENHYQVQLPTASEAEALLAKAAGAEGPLPLEARTVIEECGRLPLALALCGGMVRRRVPWSDVLEALRGRDLKYISDRHPLEQQHANIWRAIDASVHVLGSEDRKRFTELAVFALDTGAPEAAVLTLWEHTAGLRARYARELLGEFAERSLVERNEADGRIKLHDLIHNFATGMAEKEFGTITPLHQRLLEAYEKKCSRGWPSGPDDGYFLQNLCKHFVAAGRTDEAVTLLIDLPWIEVKSRAKLVFSLQDDYSNVIAAMPEAQEQLRQEQQRQARLDRWTAEITNYSRQWSDRHDRQAQGKVVNEPAPQLPAPPASCRIWTNEEIETECQRIIERPTRLDRMQAFSSFVGQECYPLLEFGARLGFVVQHAFNQAPQGPVHDSADLALPRIEAPVLTRYWNKTDRYNPRPAFLRTLEGHTSAVESVSATADERYAVSGSADKTLRVWCPLTGACVRVLKGHTASVVDVSVTADSRLAVSVSRDMTLRVWSLETGACLRLLQGHADEVESVNITPDGRRAVSGSKDKMIRVWDLETGACLWVLEGHASEVSSVSVTPDGRRAVSGGCDNTLRVWDLETGTCLQTMEASASAVESVSVTPDGKLAISGGRENTLRVWDVRTGVCLQALEGHTDRIVSVSVTPDGRRAVSWSWDHTIRVWDLDTGACLRAFGDSLGLSLDGILHGNTGLVKGVSITADGRRALLGIDNSLRICDLQTGACLSLPEGHVSRVTSVSVTPDNRRAVSGSYDRTLRVWDLEAGPCLRVLKGHTHLVTSVCVTADGRCAVSASTVSLLKATLAAVLMSTAGASSMDSFGLSGVFGGLDSRVRVWDLDTGACLRVLKGNKWGTTSVSVMPDNRRAISGSTDSTLRVWNLKRGRCQSVLEGHKDGVTSVTATPNNRRAVSGSSDGTLRVWDLETGVCLRILEGHAHRVESVSAMPDGRRVISGSWDNALRVWDLETGACQRTLLGHTDGIFGVSVMPGGQSAVSTGRDRTVRIWDLETGLCAAVVRLSAPGTAVAIAPALRRVVVGSDAGELLQFDMRGITCAPASSPAIGRTESAEVLLRREVTACLQNWGESHHNTLLSKLGLAALLNRSGRRTEAAAVRRDIGNTCLSLEGEALAAAEETIERLIPFGKDELQPVLKSKLEVLKADRERKTRREDALRRFLQGDYVEAENLLRGLLREQFEVPSTHCHLARVLLVTDRNAEARHEIDQAWAARGDAPPYVVARMLLFRCLFGMLDGVDSSAEVGRLKAALAVDSQRTFEWTIQPMLDHLRLRLGETNCAFLKALAEAVILGRAIPRLDDFPQWRDAAPPPDEADIFGRT